jgi:hypothetical protein
VIDKLAAFADQPTVSPVYVQNGNSPWAQRYAQDLREVVLEYADRLPRNVQRHLGPSELGHHCDRQLVGKMAGLEFRSGGNKLHDNWPSIVGTALHAFMDEAFKWAAQQPKWQARWLSETRVTPDPGAVSPHPGTADLFDTLYCVLGDHKMQSEAIRTRLRRDGPPYHYYIQMLLYALGYMHKGYDVQRIVLISWPRTKSSLEDLFVWEKPLTIEDLREVEMVLDKTVIREKLARFVASGELSFWDIPAVPSTDDCQYCPFFNPAALTEGTHQGCPGTSLTRSHLGVQ